MSAYRYPIENEDDIVRQYVDRDAPQHDDAFDVVFEIERHSALETGDTAMREAAVERLRILSGSDIDEVRAEALEALSRLSGGSTDGQ